MQEPINLDNIILPGLKSALYRAVEKASTVAELEANLQQFMATVTKVKAAFLSPGDKIRLGLSQKGGNA